MLRRAFVLSVVLHLAILLGADTPIFPSTANISPAQPPLIASLGKPASIASDTLQAKSSQVSSQPSVRPKLIRLWNRASQVAPPASSGVVSAVQTASPATVESGRLAASGHNQRAMPELPLVESTENVSFEGMQQYRLNLAREARRFRQYPAYARERGWEGEVIVVLSVLPGSVGPELSLGKGSGHEHLDLQALDMMKNAASRAAVPDALNGKRFRIFVPVQFRLDE